MAFESHTADQFIEAHPDDPWIIPNVVPGGTTLTVLTGPCAGGFMPHLAARVDALLFSVAYVRTKPTDPCPTVLNDTFVLEGDLQVGDPSSLVLEGDFRVDDATSLEIMTSIIRRTGPYKLLCLDNLLGFAGGLNLSYGGHASQVVLALDKLRADLDCSIVTTSKMDQSGDWLRGSSILTYAADALVDVAMNDTIAILTPLSMRDAALTGPLTFHL